MRRSLIAMASDEVGVELGADTVERCREALVMAEEKQASDPPPSPLPPESHTPPTKELFFSALWHADRRNTHVALQSFWTGFSGSVVLSVIFGFCEARSSCYGLQMKICPSIRPI